MIAIVFCDTPRSGRPGAITKRTTWFIADDYRYIVGTKRDKRVKQVGTRPGGRCDMQLSRIITDNFHKKNHFS